MALNFPGPYEVRLFYTVPGTPGGNLQHVARYNVRVDGTPDPGTSFADIDVLRRDNSPFALDGEIDDWVVNMKAIYSSSGPATIDFAELWKYEDESFDASFISTYNIAVSGTTGSVSTLAGQAICTFRTMEGGIMKMNFMESVIGVGLADTLPLANATLDTMVDDVLAGTVPWLGRDGSYPFAFIAMYPGQSEAIFKKRYR